jgi:hypothetical protein
MKRDLCGCVLGFGDSVRALIRFADRPPELSYAILEGVRMGNE